MGTWGYGIFEDDFTLDIRDQYYSFIEEVSSDQAIARLFRLYSEELEDEDDGPLFFLATSSILLERNDLRNDIKKKTIHYLELGSDQRRWRDSGLFGYLTRKRILNNLKKRLLKAHVRTEYEDINNDDLNNERFDPAKARYYVYNLIDKKTGKPYYVGSTINQELRSNYFELNPLKR